MKMPQNRKELLEQLKKKFDDLNYRWNIERNKFEANAQHAGAEARKKFDDKQKEFTKIRNDMKEKISALEVASENAWEDLKDGAEKTWNALSEAFDKASSHFRK